MGEKLGLAAQIHTITERPATRELVPHYDGESFRWLEHDYPSAIARWNYHPEVEIHLIRKSTGSYIIGDQIGAFSPGHVAIVGPGLAHDWMSDVKPGEIILNRDAAIQFTLEWLEQAISAMPELAETRGLIENSRRGIVFSGETALAAAEHIELVGGSSGAKRMSHLLALFGLLTEAPESNRRYIAHELYTSEVGRGGRAVVEAGLSYILENLAGQIKVSDAAKLAHMSVPTFSKYFKNASGMTFSDLVKALRITSACRKLDQTDYSIAAVSCAVGYHNLANFNRQFRAEIGMTPREYRALLPNEKPRSRLRALDY